MATHQDPTTVPDEPTGIPVDPMAPGRSVDDDDEEHPAGPSVEPNEPA